MDIKTFLSKSVYAGMCSNHMTRFLASRVAFTPDGALARVETDDDMLGVAKSVLDSALWVGVLERLPQSTVLLRAVMRQPTLAIGHINKAPNIYHALDSETLSYIASYNQMDIALYTYANNLLQQRYEALAHHYSPDELAILHKGVAFE
jgi:hypothetical protein